MSLACSPVLWPERTELLSLSYAIAPASPWPPCLQPPSHCNQHKFAETLNSFETGGRHHHLGSFKAAASTEAAPSAPCLQSWALHTQRELSNLRSPPLPTLPPGSPAAWKTPTQLKAKSQGGDCGSGGGFSWPGGEGLAVGCRWQPCSATWRSCPVPALVLYLLAGFPWCSEAERFPWWCASSARQGGRCSLTAAGRSLAPAASGVEAAKVTGTLLSDFSSFSPAGCMHGSLVAVPQDGKHLPLLCPKARPGGAPGEQPTEEGRGSFCLCITESQWGTVFCSIHIVSTGWDPRHESSHWVCRAQGWRQRADVEASVERGLWLDLLAKPWTWPASLCPDLCLQPGTS